MKTASNLKLTILPVMMLIVTAVSSWGQEVDSLMREYQHYSKICEYDKAIEIGERLLSCKDISDSDPLRAFILSKLGDCYYYETESGNEKAFECYSQALDIYIKTGKKEDPEVASLLMNMGNCYFNYGEVDNARDLYFQAYNIYLNKQINNNDCYGLGKLLALLGSVFLEQKDYDYAIDFLLHALDIYIFTGNEDSYDYVLLLEEIAVCYYYQEDLENAISYIQKTLTVDYPFVIHNLSGLITSQRNLFWLGNSEIYQSIYPTIVLCDKGEKYANELYEKCAMFAKGLLFSTESELQLLINESGDDVAIEKLKELNDTRAQLIKVYEKPFAQQEHESKKIEEKAKALENELLDISREFGDFTKNLQLTWQDVQERLGDNDIAIEFLSYPKFDTNSIMYIALTVRPGYDQPHLIELCEENKLNADKAYTTRELSKLIWGKLAPELDGVKNIYFSPSGLLHTIAIESMPHWENPGKMMGDLYNIYRLSSTRELAIKRNTVESSGAVLYGGIDYVCNIQNKENNRQYNHETKKVSKNSLRKHTRCADFGLRDDTRLNFLMESLIEIDNIKNVLGSDAEKVTACDATESSFKNLSRKKKKYIHIATHGFYWIDSIARQKNVRFLQLDNFHKDTEDMAMTRTGLFFSGAQHIFDSSEEFPDSIDDGVLTAQEISNLDLRGLDLVVLSACKTGLGDIVGSEGVFGLQRGFKKAGAQSIIMSLWPVDDKATRYMMEGFYKALKSGKSKQEAFHIAQDKVKEIYGNFKDEKHKKPTTRPHWAAFILLDAVE